MHQETVLIRRSNRGTVTNGVEDTGEVYVTGPHFGTPEAPEIIYSSTKLVSEASPFAEETANNLIASGKWAHASPCLVPVEQATDLQ